MKTRAFRRSLGFLSLCTLVLSSALTFAQSAELSSPGSGREAIAGERDRDQDSPEKVQRREEWFMKPRTVPGMNSADLLRQANEYKFKQRALNIEMEKVRRDLAAATGTTVPITTTAVGSGSTTWVPLGPKPIVHDPVDGQNYGNAAGRVSAIAVDQADATGATVYVGGAYGGVWKSTNANAATLSSIHWTPIIDNQATLAVGAIAVNGNTILVGTGEAKSAVDSYYGLGILRSTDGGNTWTQIKTADGGATNISGLGFGHIAFNTDNPNLVVASTIGTGLSVGLGALTGNFARGIFYSNDNGATWHSVTVTEGASTFQASTNGLIYDHTQGKFYAAMRYHGVYSSSDGATWTRTAGQPGAVNLTSCPSAFSGTVPNGCPFWRAELAIRSDKDEMYVWFANDQYNSQGVYKSTNGGGSWTALQTSNGFDTCDDTGTCSTYQLYYNMTMAAVPNKTDADTNATDLYLGSGNIFKCTMNTANPTCGSVSEPYRFMDLTHVYRGSCFGVAKVHPDQHSMAYSSTVPGIIYFGNDGGIYRTLNASGLNTQSCVSVTLPFDNLNDNIGALTQYIWATPDPNDATGVIAGAQDNGTSGTGSAIRSAKGLSGQQFFELMSGDGGHTDIRKDVSPNYWYQSFTDAIIDVCTLGSNCGFTQFAQNVYIDNTGGTPGADTLGGDKSAFYAPFMVDPQNGAYLIVGTCRVWRGNSSGTYTGAALSPNLNTATTAACTDTDSLGNPYSKIQSLAEGGPTTTHGSQVIYAGMDDGTIAMTLTADSGGWTTVTPSTTLNPGTAPAGFAFGISSIAVDKSDATGKTAYATVQGFGANHVLMTTNGGTSWTGIGAPGANGLPDAPANSVAIDPDDHTVIYVGTDVGVFVTTNGGALWTEVGPTEPGGASSGYLPNTVVTHVAVSKAGGSKELVVSTYGRGVWTAQLTTASGVTFSPTSHDFSAQMSTTTTNFSFTVTNTGSASILLSSVSLTGTGSAMYSETDNCGGVTLAVNGTCSVTVSFKPTAAGSYPANLVITDNLSNQYSAGLNGTGVVPAAMTSPANGSTLASSSQAFTWTSVQGASQYFLWVGTTLGGSDIFNGTEGTSTTATISGLPTTGVTVYVRLLTSFNGNWYSNDTSYTSQTIKAAMTSPANSSTLPQGPATFTWGAATGAQQYWIWIGHAQGGNEIYNQGQNLNTQVTISNLPMDGSTLYLRLLTGSSGGWAYNDYTYTAGKVATITSPTPGSALGSSATFNWSTVNGAQSYFMWIGFTVGQQDIYAAAVTNGSTTVTGLPQNGAPIYVRLFTQINNIWLYNDYVYQATIPKAAVLTPAQGSTLTGSSVGFTWSAAAGADAYYIWAGNAVGASNYYNAGQALNTSGTVTGLPVDGSTVYLRLFTYTHNQWLFNDYTYTATVTKATMTSPANASTLPGASASFQWTSVPGTTTYWIWAGSTVGGNDYYNQGQGLNTTGTVSGLPTNGGQVFLRLFTFINNSWLYNDYTYTAATAKATMNTPTPGSTLSGGAATFNWTGVTGAVQYWIWIGTTPGGNNLYNQGQALNTSVSVTGLPTNSSTIYVRLFTYSGGWQWNDYTYTAGP